MINKIGANGQTKEKGIILLLIIILAIFLNQQRPMFGYNLSFSDFAAVLLFSIFLFKKNLFFPRRVVYFFILLSVIVLTSALLISPMKYDYSVNINLVVDNYLKLISSFLYFILGYSFLKNKKIDLVYKWYSIGAVVVGLIGILIVFFNVGIFDKRYFFEGSRYIGLMYDPNYFAVVQCTALVYFMRNNGLKRIFRLIGCVVIFLSIALSGSKTGMIIFIVYTIIVLGQKVLINKNTKQLIKNLAVVLIIIVSLPFLLNIFNVTMDKIVSVHPVFNRVKIVFIDFESALSDSGSSRDSTWSGGMDIIKKSPIFGVGVGSYLTVRNIVHGGGGLSHNTYLQIMAEWGMPMALTLFIFIFYILVKHFVSTNKIQNESIIVGDIFIILLIGSMSLSLNNARMFWLFLGALYNSSQNIKIRIQRNDVTLRKD